MRSLQVVVMVAAATSWAHAGNPLDKPAFTATPKELLATAKTATSDTGAVILREDETTSYDDRGRVTRRLRFVVAITSQDGVDGWSTLWRAWAPWYQDRPTVRARVITPTGEVHELDPARIDEQSAKAGGGKYLSAAINGLTAGAVVEYEMVTVDRELPTGGRSITLDIGNYSPTTSSHVTFSAPATLHVRLVERGLPTGVKGNHVVARGRESWTYTFGPRPAVVVEALVPPDVLVQPMIEATITPSWSAVAKGFAAAAPSRFAGAYPAELPHGATLETASAITAWVHHHVEYSGAALGDDPIVPVDLDAVIKRGTANTNELAALLVTLLRSGGIQADVVPVNRGGEHDVDRDVPALSLFDGVLVRARIAGADVWIEPSARYQRVGQLPAYDQERPALDVAEGRLITTPAAAASANTVHETRTFELAQMGAGRAHEVSHEGGVFEYDQRKWIREQATTDVRKDLERYGTDVYQGQLAAYTSSDPDDFTRPFEVTLDVDHSGRTDTTWSAAEVHLHAADTVPRLPELLRTKPDKPRVHELLTHLVQVYEIENRIVVPDGFTIPAPPPGRTRDLGVLRLTEQHRVDGRIYIVSFRLELTKPRMSAAEVTATQQAVADLRGERTDLVFPNTAWTLTDKGSFQAALAESDRVLAANPRNAYEHARRSQMLLLMGDGAGARREAHTAVGLAPKDATMYSVLGYVLSHDLVGREWAPGHDHAGARAALEKARSLEPHYYGAVLQLAGLLERDGRGRKFEPGSDPRAAAEVSRVLDELEPSDEHAHAVILDLLWAGDAAAAEKAARARPESKTRNQLLLAAVAMNSGAEAAIREAPANGREAAIDGAAGMLMLLRRYDLMAKLFAETGSLKTRTKGEILLELKRFDAPFRPGPEPKDVAFELELEELDPARKPIAFWDADTAKSMLGEAKAAMPKFEGMTTPLMADMLQSLMTATVDGDANAWRVEIDMFGIKEIIYLAADRSGPKVIGAPSQLAGVGRHVLRLAGKHDDAAMRLLDWAARDAPKKVHLDKIWGATLPRDPKAVALAGAMLADDKERNITAGKACGVTTSDGQLLCDLMVADGYRRTHRWDELLAHASVWAGRVPSWAALQATYAQIDALEHLGRLEEAEHVIDDSLGKHPGDQHLLWQRVEAAAAAHHPDQAAVRLDAVAQAEPNNGMTLNNIAWTRIAMGVGFDSALDEARRAADLEKGSRFAANTLAGAETETDNLRDAVKEIQHAIELGHDDASSADWYVIGRIREKAGLRDDAIAAYRHVTKTETVEMFPTIYELTSARLKALGAAKK